MDAKELKAETSLAECRSDVGPQFRFSDGEFQQAVKNKPYQDFETNSVVKVDVPTSRPCAVIGPDRIVPPPTSNVDDLYLKKIAPVPWLDQRFYSHPPEYSNKYFPYQIPTRNISPRQTFQENMSRVIVPPMYNSIKTNEDSNTIEKSLTKTMNVPVDSKFCNVPFVNSISDQKSMKEPDVYVSNFNSLNTKSACHGYPSVSHMPGTRPYRVPDLCHYPDYPSCSGPRQTTVNRPHRSVHDETTHAYPESYYYEGNVRYKPYPNVKDKYAPPRYDYVCNYANSFQTGPQYPNKYDFPKPVPAHPYMSYTQVPTMPSKYNRAMDPMLESYQRSAPQPNFNIPFHNQVMNPYGPISNTCHQSKISSYAQETTLKSANSNKLSSNYDPARVIIDFEPSRIKSYPTNENYYDMRPHPSRNMHVTIPNNMQPVHSNVYFRKENLPFKNTDMYMHNFKHGDHPYNINNAPSRLPSQFSPNIVSMSPSDSNTSNDTNNTQGNTQEDYGYVSQSSSASFRSLDSYQNRFPPEHYRRYEFNRNQFMQPKTSKEHAVSKSKKNINVRQFFQMWNDDEDENVNNSKESIPPNRNITGKFINNHNSKNNSQEELYVLRVENVPTEELSKYEHIQKVSKLPENIKGYNSIELLHQFEEAIQSSETHCIIKSNNSKPLLPRNQVINDSRPMSPIDIEAKISQSVIHKEVGCNFEIKPCSPKMLVELATPVQSSSEERIIDKVTNPLVTGLTLSNNHETVHKTIMDRNESSTSCKMTGNSPFREIDTNEIAKSNYSFQDLEGNSGVCLASLPRLDNDIELTFPEINQQFLNYNKKDTLAGFKDIPLLMDPVNNKNENLDEEVMKLSKYRKTKKNDCSQLSKTQSIRTDSVIIKNPDTQKNNIEHDTTNKEKDCLLLHIDQTSTMHISKAMQDSKNEHDMPDRLSNNKIEDEYGKTKNFVYSLNHLQSEKISCNTDFFDLESTESKSFEEILPTHKTQANIFSHKLTLNSEQNYLETKELLLETLFSEETKLVKESLESENSYANHSPMSSSIVLPIANVGKQNINETDTIKIDVNPTSETVISSETRHKKLQDIAMKLSPKAQVDLSMTSKDFIENQSKYRENEERNNNELFKTIDDDNYNNTVLTLNKLSDLTAVSKCNDYDNILNDNGNILTMKDGNLKNYENDLSIKTNHSNNIDDGYNLSVNTNNSASDFTSKKSNDNHDLHLESIDINNSSSVNNPKPLATDASKLAFEENFLEKEHNEIVNNNEFQLMNNFENLIVGKHENMIKEINKNDLNMPPKNHNKLTLEQINTLKVSTNTKTIQSGQSALDLKTEISDSKLDGKPGSDLRSNYIYNKSNSETHLNNNVIDNNNIVTEKNTDQEMLSLSLPTIMSNHHELNLTPSLSNQNIDETCHNSTSKSPSENQFKIKKTEESKLELKSCLADVSKTNETSEIGHTSINLKQVMSKEDICDKFCSDVTSLHDSTSPCDYLDFHKTSENNPATDKKLTEDSKFSENDQHLCNALDLSTIQNVIDKDLDIPVIEEKYPIIIKKCLSEESQHNETNKVVYHTQNINQDYLKENFDDNTCLDLSSQDSVTKNICENSLDILSEVNQTTENECIAELSETNKIVNLECHDLKQDLSKEHNININENASDMLNIEKKIAIKCGSDVLTEASYCKNYDKVDYAQETKLDLLKQNIHSTCLDLSKHQNDLDKPLKDQNKTLKNKDYVGMITESEYDNPTSVPKVSSIAKYRQMYPINIREGNQQEVRKINRPKELYAWWVQKLILTCDVPLQSYCLDSKKLDILNSKDIIDNQQKSNTELSIDKTKYKSTISISELNNVDIVRSKEFKTYDSQNVISSEIALKENSANVSLKRSLSDSALDSLKCYENGEKPSKRNKYNTDEMFSENICKMLQTERRNSVSTFENDENVSYCIVMIKDGCLIDDNNDDSISVISNSSDCDKNNVVVSESFSDYEDDTIVNDQYDSTYVPSIKHGSETWIEDVARMETVVDDIAEDIELGSIVEDIDPCSITDDIEASSIDENRDTCSIADDIKTCFQGQNRETCSIADDIETCSIAEDREIYSIAEDIEICSTAEDIETCSQVENRDTCSTADDIETSSIAKDRETYSIADDIETCSTAEYRETCSQAENRHTCFIADDIETCSIPEDRETYSLAEDIETCSTAEDIDPCSVVKNYCSNDKDREPCSYKKNSNQNSPNYKSEVNNIQSINEIDFQSCSQTVSKKETFYTDKRKQEVIDDPIQSFCCDKDLTNGFLESVDKSKNSDLEYLISIKGSQNTDLETKYDTDHSCDSLNNLSYTTQECSSSPEVSSTTSEEKNTILLKISQYRNSSVIESVNNTDNQKKRSLPDVQTFVNYNKAKPLITKAAQKYIPPINETLSTTFKVKLHLPQNNLIKLKQLKISKDYNKSESNIKVEVPSNPLFYKNVPKKPKPGFEEVLKSIDDFDLKKHKDKNKKSKNYVPKVLIKKHQNGCHYASTSNESPDLTGRKWQPWVFIKKDMFIDKMALKHKTKAIYSRRRNAYVLTERFQKYRSASKTEFVISQPTFKSLPSGTLKYTIKLKHSQ